MIESFACAETLKIWQGEHSRRLPSDMQKVALRKLRMVAAAKNILDLRIPPNNRLEMLKGTRKGQWSIRINDQWHVCFHWREGEAKDVEIVDYH